LVEKCKRRCSKVSWEGDNREERRSDTRGMRRPRWRARSETG
jgi:hypothetical protein